MKPHWPSGGADIAALPTTISSRAINWSRISACVLGIISRQSASIRGTRRTSDSRIRQGSARTQRVKHVLTCELGLQCNCPVIAIACLALPVAFKSGRGYGLGCPASHVLVISGLDAWRGSSRKPRDQ